MADNNVEVAAYDAMIDALNRFERRTTEIGAFLGNSARMAKEVLNGDMAACLLENKVTAIGSKMLLVMEQSSELRKAMVNTRDALIRIRRHAETEE